MSQAYQTSESKANIEMMGLTPASFHNEVNSDDGFMNLLLKDQRPGEAKGGFLHDATAHHADESAQFMAYHLAELELGGYQNSNVSSTLGLRHTMNSLSAPNTHQPGFTGVDKDMYNTRAHPGVTAASSDYESMKQLDQRQQFAVLNRPLYCMNDFVA